MTSADPPSGPPSARSADPAGGTDRLVTLTDGVVAIAMTLLALDLKPDLGASATSSDIAHFFRVNAGSYVAFVIAFVVIAQYWLLHRRLMHDVDRHDNAVAWANMLFLFAITLLPLTTFLQGKYSAPLATSLFAGDLLLIGIATTLMSELIRRRDLRANPESPAARRRAHYRAAMSIAIPLLVAVLAWVLTGHSSYLFLLYLVADVPGRIATRHDRE